MDDWNGNLLYGITSILSVFQENTEVYILQLLKALLNEAPVNRGELHSSNFEKHSPLLKLEYIRIFQYAQKSSWVAEGTDQQETQ